MMFVSPTSSRLTVSVLELPLLIVPPNETSSVATGELNGVKLGTTFTVHLTSLTSTSPAFLAVSLTVSLLALPL